MKDEEQSISQKEKSPEKMVPIEVKQSEPINQKKQATEFWPRKRRSDITMSRYV